MTLLNPFFGEFGGMYVPQILIPALLQLEKAFVDVKSGDQLIGVYLPGIGCRFYSQQALLAEIPDEIFANAFFSIWLDPRTKDSNLRQQLLGNNKSTAAITGSSM